MLAAAFMAPKYAVDGAERGARELPIVDPDPVARHGLVEAAEVVGADLVSESAGAAMEHHEDLPRPVNAERSSESRVEDPVRGHRLDLEIVVS
jgi:hypothetical protein